MADYGTKMTDRAVRETERRLSRVYREAARDIKSKMKDWEKAHAEREKKYRQQLAEGKITQADFDAWMRGQVFQGNQWKARQNQINEILLNADKAAAQIVNEGKMGVFAANANYVGYELERGVGVRTGFNLYDQNTVSRLIRKDPDMLPKAREGVQKDKSYRWYNKQVASAVTQGIVQGEGVREIAQRIVDKTSEGNYKSALRHARTAYTGAQNAGRMEGLHQAQGLGINVKKQWVATNDDRTRDTHAELDGQIAEVDEPFITSEGSEIMYPGDPTAEPGEVYNCRCTLVYVYPDYPSDMSGGEPTGDASFEEWEDMKREDQEWEDASEDVTEAIEESPEIDMQQPINPYDDAGSQSWGQYSESLPKDTAREIEKELFENRGNMTANEYWRSLVNGESTNERIERLLRDQLPDINIQNTAEGKADKENGLELYRRFVEGGSQEIHELAGFDPIADTYNSEKADEKAMRDLDSVFTKTTESMHLYKGLPMTEDGVDRLNGEWTNPTVSSTSTSRQTAMYYMENAYDLGMEPVLFDIDVQKGVPVADAQKILGSSGMKGFEKEITVGRNTVWEYDPPQLRETSSGDEYYLVKVRVKPRR